MKNILSEKKILLLLLIITALISFSCSRGKDGQLFFFFVLHTLLLMGMIFLSFKAKFKLTDIVITSLLYFGGSLIGVLLYSHLDEMAGMLFIFYPIFALGYFVITIINLFLIPKFLK